LAKANGNLITFQKSSNCEELNISKNTSDRATYKKRLPSSKRTMWYVIENQLHLRGP
jgi:hypothetical protein